jgi:hypothetical protein
MKAPNIHIEALLYVLKKKKDNRILLPLSE